MSLSVLTPPDPGQVQADVARALAEDIGPVSYTHLTLPTILRV